MSHSWAWVWDCLQFIAPISARLSERAEYPRIRFYRASSLQLLLPNQSYSWALFSSLFYFCFGVCSLFSTLTSFQPDFHAHTLSFSALVKQWQQEPKVESRKKLTCFTHCCPPTCLGDWVFAFVFCCCTHKTFCFLLVFLCRSRAGKVFCFFWYVPPSF